MTDASSIQTTDSARLEHRRQWLVWVLMILVLLTFGRICSHGFTTWDDNHTISQNPDLNPPTLHKLAHYWYEPALALYIPVTYMVWGLLAFLSQIGATGPVAPNPWLFHAASVLSHLLAALVVFAILRRLTRRSIAAFLGAAIFAVHPFQVETVAWASGLKDLLCGLFSLIAIWLFIIQRQNEASRTQNTPGSWPFDHSAYLIATLALILAMLCKPSAMVTPVIALIVDHWLLNRRWRKSFVALWPWFVLAAAVAAMARWSQPSAGTPLTAWYTRPLIYTDAIAFYLWKLVWPINLAIDYGRSPIHALQQGWIYWTWVFPVGVAIVIFLLRRRRWLVAGALLFLAGWLPVSGLVGFLFQYYSTVANHYMYLPMFGIAVIVAYFVMHYPKSAGVWAVLTLLLAIRSFLQAGYWSDNQKLYRHILAVTPRSYMAHTNLASLLIADHHVDQAEQLLRQATQMNPDYYQAWETLAELLTARGKTDQAISAEEQAMRTRALLPSHGGATYAQQLDLFGQLLMKKQRYEEAAQQFQHALQVNPDYTPAADHLRQAREKIAAGINRQN